MLSWASSTSLDLNPNLFSTSVTAAASSTVIDSHLYTTAATSDDVVAVIVIAAIRGSESTARTRWK